MRERTPSPTGVDFSFFYEVHALGFYFAAKQCCHVLLLSSQCSSQQSVFLPWKTPFSSSVVWGCLSLRPPRLIDGSFYAPNRQITHDLECVQKVPL
ncbi:hypothetical protein CKAN_00446600 [Cinnamomum micranthum f. kanehirae]|uniref:Uncharacterized protein n=1 Tax=Cinnamomum micranthum f. kanehirae TaxID=337451 RepID=A0A3S3NVM7_9MAGN|nr:hypothetical protein CKAN_00446600 [Cinnamomum micranthum f. kanehirae]